MKECWHGREDKFRFPVCIKINRNIEPACGSGSLLLKLAKVLEKENVRQGFLDRKLTSLHIISAKELDIPFDAA